MGSARQLELDALVFTTRLFNYLGLDTKVDQPGKKLLAGGRHTHRQVNRRHDPLARLACRVLAEPVGLADVLAAAQPRLAQVVRWDRNGLEAHGVGRSGGGLGDHVVVVFFSRARLPPSRGTRFRMMCRCSWSRSLCLKPMN